MISEIDILIFFVKLSKANSTICQDWCLRTAILEIWNET